MNRCLIAYVLGIVLFSGCLLIPRETRYLQSAQGHASQEEVIRQLGRPAAATVNPTGEAVWVYRVREQEAGNRWTSTGLWCDEYVLTFDADSILRRWTHESHFHGGELMPSYCVPGGFNAPVAAATAPR